LLDVDPEGVMAILNRITESLEPPRWATPERFEERVRDARRVATDARQAAREAAVAAAVTIKEHPLRSVAGAALVGTLTGVMIGFVAGWLVQPARKS
jgi:ElaB/YqjD/DUF883 family membrane-anchored ribosome-binding protein